MCSLHVPPAKKPSSLFFEGSIPTNVVRTNECMVIFMFCLTNLITQLWSHGLLFLYSASFSENYSTGVAISLVNYLGCTGSLTTNTRFTYQTFTDLLITLPIYWNSAATSLYCSPKSTLASGTIISLDTPLSFVWSLVEANLYTIGCWVWKQDYKLV